MLQNDTTAASTHIAEQLEPGSRVRLCRPVRCGGVLYQPGTIGELVVARTAVGVRLDREAVKARCTVTLYWIKPPVLGVDLEPVSVDRQRGFTQRASVCLAYPLPPKSYRRLPQPSSLQLGAA